MIVTDKFLWIHFIKSGGSLFRHMVIATDPGHWESPRKWQAHCGADHIPEKYKHLPVFSHVRNPWDWYISWYVFFAMPERRDTFFGIKNMDFKTALRLALFERTDEQDQFSIDYGEMQDKNIGLYTFMYNQAYMVDGHEAVVTFLRFESLRKDIVRLVPLTDEQRTMILQMNRVNVTKGRTRYQDYYDEESRQWVADKDKAVIDKFGYKFEV